MQATRLIITASAGLILLAACGNDDTGLDEALLDNASPDSELLPDLELAGRTIVDALFISLEGEPVGRVEITNTPKSGVLMRLDIQGLEPGWHGVHLHQTGDCSDWEDGFKASGGHINPDGVEHGFMNPLGYERANLPNIYARQNGRATIELFVDRVTLFAVGLDAPVEPYPLVDTDGFAIVVYEGPDDHLSQPIGGAGDRVACAAITGND